MSKIEGKVIDVRNFSDDLKKLIQYKLFELGYKWGFVAEIKYLTVDCYFVEEYSITHSTFTYASNHEYNYSFFTLDDLFNINTKKVIEIDGKKIEISEESYNAFKKQFKD